MEESLQRLVDFVLVVFITVSAACFVGALYFGGRGLAQFCYFHVLKRGRLH